jgi:hypothetical protein
MAETIVAFPTSASDSGILSTLPIIDSYPVSLAKCDARVGAPEVRFCNAFPAAY